MPIYKGNHCACGCTLHSTHSTIGAEHCNQKSSRSSIKLRDQMAAALNVEPDHSTFKVGGSMNRHDIVNHTAQRHAFKVKSSNNEFYRVGTVYGFVEPEGRATLEIHRLPGGKPGPDRFVVQWAEVPAEETDPKAPFLAQAQSGEVVFTVDTN